MNRLKNCTFFILVLFAPGTLGQPLGEFSNEKDVFSNIFHLNPPVHDDLKGNIFNFQMSQRVYFLKFKSTVGQKNIRTIGR